ncbi:breast cancer anti-estrogen resistance protein 3 homolog [Lepisosteus oculatus]|uniref:breast cancer anti-estrogen resistance protein 3 homolog n=1 Tax=Lepisosteus oculatus TaxID=7918 RepID=UPI0035F50138
MNNRSISWWLGEIGLPQYTKILERGYYGLEGLMYVTDADLKEAGIESQEDRATILDHLRLHQDRMNGSTESLPSSPGRVTRKHSLGSSMDLIRSSSRLSSQSLSLFRQSFLPRLRRRDKTAFSSCSQLATLDEVFSPPLPGPHSKRDPPELGLSSTLPPRRGQKSKRKSVGTYLSQLKVFGGKGGMDTAKEALKKELEEELKLSTEDLRSHAWYHGQVHREVAGTLVERDGDFLIRDSQSSSGDYVLTCRWKDQPMHFKIIRVVLRPKKGYSRELFQFEQDQFDNVPALVRFHVGSRKPISDASGAIISHPVNRTVPLRLTSEPQGRSTPQTGGEKKQTCQGPSSNSVKRLSLNSSQMEASLHNGSLLREKSGSHPASLECLGRRPSLQSALSDSNLRSGVPQSSQSNGTDRDGPPVSPVFRTGSEPLLNPPGGCHATLQPEGGTALRGSDGQLHSRAPPKPLRISVIFPNTLTPQSSAPANDPSSYYGELVPRAPPPSSSRCHVDRLRAEEKWQSRARITETSFGFLDSGGSSLFVEDHGMIAEEEDLEGEPHFVRPEIETTSCFRLDRFQSLLLPENNRPLDPGVIKRLKELFTKNDAKTTAMHILHVDCKVARITGVTDEQKRLMGVGSGLELITLPHGRQLRLDLMERHHLIALGIAIDILGCTGTVSQRADVLHKVIQLANELRHSAGDLFAFSAVMKALELPQVTRLEMTWRDLRRNHTESAIAFEKNLKPFLKALNEGQVPDETSPCHTALPHVLPLLKLMEGVDLGEHTERGCELLLRTLEVARSFSIKAEAYQAQAQTLLSGWEPIPELLEAFHTEFALRLLWGQKGAELEQKERYEKFNKILSVLSDKLEPVESSKH